MTAIFAASASASAMPEPQSNIISALTGSNGTSAGQALLGLYTQFKADGKLDLKNAANISNIINLASNIKALKGQKTATTDNVPASFLSGLISGSKNLVNTQNSNNVLGALSQISNLDLSSESTKEAAASTAKTAASGLLSKLASKSGSTSSSTPAGSSNLLSAASTLTSLFGSLKK